MSFSSMTSRKLRILLRNLYFQKESSAITYEKMWQDDGLGILRSRSARTIDRTRKDIIQIFKECGFQIEIATNLFEVNFLDVTFNLKNDSYRPYKKPNDSLMYINTSSNHPQQILKQLPMSINERLSKNSSSETVFNESKTEYIEALKRSGHKDPLMTFNKTPSKKKRSRKRNIIWFNPPFNKNVSSNIAKTFLKLLDKHFSKDKKLHKLFNRHNVKVSYSCTPNMGRIISLFQTASVWDERSTCREKSSKW